MNNLPQKPNILILLNDQDSATVPQNWPQSFENDHLPAMKRLKKNGLTFNRMFAGSAACSPSRATILTSTYPPENGVIHTMAVPLSSASKVAGDPPIGYTQEALRPSQLNLAYMLKAAGYKVVWKGKWHLSHPVDGTDQWKAEDIQYMEDTYGFYDWNPGDAGVNRQDPSAFAMGTTKNDIRYVEGNHSPKIDKTIEDTFIQAEGAIEFIKNYKPETGPFCLIVSLVNPHDIHVAPHFLDNAGYKEEDFAKFSLPIPENADEDLSMKPEIQEIWRESCRVNDEARGQGLKNQAQILEDQAKLLRESGNNPKAEELEAQAKRLREKGDRAIFPPETPSEKDKIQASRQLFVNFYGYLRKLVDEQMNSILEELDHKGLTENTLIVRTADHGEMCLAHGLREKAFTAYEETIHIPLIISNPQLFPEPKQTNVLASSIDLLPTLAKIVGFYDTFKFAFRGSDLTPLFTNPEATVYCSYKENGNDVERDYIHFTYDDGFLPDRFQYTPLYLRTIRTNDDWKYSVYFNKLGNSFEYELYDLNTDPHENNNLAGENDDLLEKQQELHTKLEDVMRKMGTLPIPYWIYTQQMANANFIPPLRWPTAADARLSAKMQFEAKTAKQQDKEQPVSREIAGKALMRVVPIDRQSILRQEVRQVPLNQWWFGI